MYDPYEDGLLGQIAKQDVLSGKLNPQNSPTPPTDPVLYAMWLSNKPAEDNSPPVDLSGGLFNSAAVGKVYHKTSEWIFKLTMCVGLIGLLLVITVLGNSFMDKLGFLAMLGFFLFVFYFFCRYTMVWPATVVAKVWFAWMKRVPAAVKATPLPVKSTIALGLLTYLTYMTIRLFVTAYLLRNTEYLNMGVFPRSFHLGLSYGQLLSTATSFLCTVPFFAVYYRRMKYRVKAGKGTLPTLLLAGLGIVVVYDVVSFLVLVSIPIQDYLGPVADLVYTVESMLDPLLEVLYTW